MARDFEQARRIIRGETAERRQQDRQSLLNLELATRSRRNQLNNFYGGKDDPNNSFGGIKDPQKQTQVRVMAKEIYLRVILYDSFIYNPGGGNKANQDLYQACVDAATLLLYGEAQEIVGGRIAQRGELNQLFNSLPQQSPPDRPNAASQQLINNRTNGIFRAITGFDRPRNKAEERLLETLRNAILIQWNVNGAARITDTPESQSESRSTVGQNPQSQNPVERFKQRLKQKALQQLDENRDLILKAREKYQNPDAGALGRLRQVVEADERLESTQKQLEKHSQNLELRLRIQTTPETAEAAQGTGPNAAQLQAQLDQNQAKLNEIQQVRITLLALYPASGLLQARDVKESNSDAKLLATLNERLESVLSDIDRARQGIVSGDIQLLELEPLVAAVREETPEAEKAAVDKYLRDQRNLKNTFQFLGYFAQIGLTVAAFLTKGLTAVISARIGTATGIGQALYEFEQASDLNTIAKTGQAGGNQLLADPEAARFNYIMGWVNLVLAGIDGVLAVREGGTFFRGPGVTERIMQGRGAQVLSRLQPEEIAKFDRAMQLQRAGQIKDAQDLLDELKSGLKAKFNEEGEQIFVTANSLFERASLSPGRVSELNGFANALPPDLQNRVPIQVNPNLPGRTVQVHYEQGASGAIDRIYIQVGPEAGVRDIQLHVQTVRLMQRYSGLAGQARVMLERIRSWIGKNGEPPSGTLAWEAKLEIEKLPQIIKDRLEELKAGNLAPEIEAKVLDEIEELKEQLAKYQQTLDEMDVNPGVGFVAADTRIARPGEAERSGYPPLGEVGELYYYVWEYDPALGRPRFSLQKRDGVRGKKYRLVEIGNNQYRIIEDERSNSQQAARKARQQQTLDQYSQPATELPGLEDAIQAGNLAATTQAYLRRWEKAIIEINQVLNKQLGNGNDLNLIQLIEGLPQNNADEAASLFRNRLRQQIADKILLETNGSERMKLWESCSNIISQPPHSVKDKGELFTVFRNKDFAIRQTGNIESIDNASRTKLQNTLRNADDAIRVIPEQGLANGGPPQGNYIVEDKNSPQAFDEAQARRYSNFLNEEGENKLKNKIYVGDTVYDGVVYFFNSQRNAQAAQRYINSRELNQYIYISYYDINGNLKWIPRS